ncbi:MAG: 30S ribosomal protein S11, partial [Anaerolineales bacterium]
MAQNVRSTRRAASARKTKRTLSSAQVHIFASFNNTIVTVTDQQGNTVCWGSSGSAGFKGSR